MIFEEGCTPRERRAGNAETRHGLRRTYQRNHGPKERHRDLRLSEQRNEKIRVDQRKERTERTVFIIYMPGVYHEVTLAAEACCRMLL